MPVRVCCVDRFVRLARIPSNLRCISNLAARRSSQTLPTSPARTRFAPSPTGYLHLGSLRTALYNYLLAKATGGQFILRIENTDSTRTVPNAEEHILQNLRWAGLQWEEGPQVGGPYGPYRQSERRSIYDDHARLITESGKAYRCFCSKERLLQLAEHRSRLGLPTDYDRACAGLSNEESDEKAHKGEEFVLRLKVDGTSPAWYDLVYGKVGTEKKLKVPVRDREGYDDPILVKSDGMPTYHFANVVDDHHMRVTHVVRAIEWMPSTPKHLAIYRAFGWDPPEFAHVGLLQNAAGEKLSKRDGATNVEQFIDLGYSPEALVNYVALLGWSHRQSSDVMSLDELVNNFTLKFTKGNSIVKVQKLDFLQSQHIQRRIVQGGEEFDLLVSRLAEAASHRIQDTQKPTIENVQALSSALLKADAANFVTIPAFLDRNIHFFVEPTLSEATPEIDATQASLASTVSDVLSRITVGEWQGTFIKAALEDLKVVLMQKTTDSGAQDLEKDVKLANSRLSRYLRWALMGGNHGPPLVSTLELLGKEKTLARIEKARKG